MEDQAKLPLHELTPPPIPQVVLETDGLRLISSGAVTIPLAKPTRIVIGAIAVELKFAISEDKDVKIERQAVADELLLRYIIHGKLPPAPHTTGIFAEEIGVANSYPVWLAFGVSTLTAQATHGWLHYSVFLGSPVAAEGVSPKDGGAP